MPAPQLEESVGNVEEDPQRFRIRNIKRTSGSCNTKKVGAEVVGRKSGALVYSSNNLE